MPDACTGTFVSRLVDRLVSDGHDSEPWSYLVLAACEGQAELAATLDGAQPSTPRAAATSSEPGPEPPGAYLHSITVEGFRGIAASATLQFPPGPGLTLVVGRNGSGKSSFAEALELLLTGGTRRWDGRSSVWKDGWRCLHQTHPASIQAEFHVDERGTVTVSRDWLEGADLDAATTWYQEKGRPRRPYSELGWEQMSRVHRPLLPYAELGTVFDNPSGVHDALSQVLGLGELDDVLKLLQAERKARDARVHVANGRLTGMMPRLQSAAAADDRAKRCLAALSGKKRSLSDVADVLNRDLDTPADPAVALLRNAHGLAPDPDAVRQAAGELIAAAADVEHIRATDAGRARQLANLLAQALGFHASHGGEDCPVCQVRGSLGQNWREQTTAQLALLRAEAETAEKAHRRLEAAQKTARRLLDVPKGAFERIDPVGLASSRAALIAVERWHQGSTIADPDDLARHLTTHVDELAEVIEAFNTEVHTELARREDVWQPIANDLRAWLPDGKAAEAAHAQVAELKNAEAWFKDVQADLKNERFKPIAEQAIALWQTLRQHSNVELGSVHLQGTATRRSVVLDVTVDGVAGAALGVMSQGELNALALSLFMPRASMADSPFRFMVIDDPVQSMDPSRVDGLARALHDASTKRQVIVFTHDDRLAESVRRLGIPATQIEVLRRPRSRVETRKAKGPVEGYLDDGDAVLRTRELPDNVRRRVVPGLCRSAVEAACIEVFRRRRLRRGDAHQQVEDALTGMKTLTQRMAATLFDDPGRGSDVYPSLDKRWKGGWAADVFRAVNEGAHERFDGDLDWLTTHARRLAAKVMELN